MEFLSLMMGACCGLPLLGVSWLIYVRFPRWRKGLACVYGIGATGFVILVGFGVRQWILDERVVEAARDGDAVRLRAVLDSGGAIENADPVDGPWPGVEAAARSGDYASVKLLLQRGAAPVSSRWDDSILDVARSGRRTDLVALLKRYGAK